MAMPAKRRLPKKRSNAITAEAIAAFHNDDWLMLHRALALRPWEASPLDVEPGEPIRAGTGWEHSVPKALELRAQLESEASAEDPQNRSATCSI
jgi:hypothetical protein